MIYSEKEPLLDKRVTQGLCPKHFEISLKELKEKMEKLEDRSGSLRILIVEDSAIFRELFKEALRSRFPSANYTRQRMARRPCSKFTLRNEAALTAPLGARWALKLANIVDYTSNPQPTFERANIQYLLTLGFSF